MDINDIAKLAGVSRATVSRYLNDGYVSKEKRERIARVIDETGYVPSQQAKSLRTGRSNTVGIVIPKINSHSVSRMVAGMTDEFTHAGYQVLLANTDNDERLELEYLTLFTESNRVDGVILIATVITPAHRRHVKALKVPVVIVGQQAKAASCVYHDERMVMHDVTSVVLDGGARRPCYLGVTNADLAAGKDRKLGFLDACAEHGVRPPASACIEGEFSCDSGYLDCEQMLSAHPELDALVCATDEIALGALTCLREYGRRVPEDVQVTGLGNSELAVISYPPLTSVHYYYRTTGTEAARMLVEAIEGTNAPLRQLKMGYEVHKRSTTR